MVRFKKQTYGKQWEKQHLDLSLRIVIVKKGFVTGQIRGSSESIYSWFVNINRLPGRRENQATSMYVAYKAESSRIRSMKYNDAKEKWVLAYIHHNHHHHHHHCSNQVYNFSPVLSAAVAHQLYFSVYRSRARMEPKCNVPWYVHRVNWDVVLAPVWLMYMRRCILNTLPQLQHVPHKHWEHHCRTELY